MFDRCKGTANPPNRQILIEFFKKKIWQGWQFSHQVSAMGTGTWQIKVQLFSETNKEFNNNLVVWQVFIWLFGKFLFGCLASFYLVVW